MTTEAMKLLYNCNNNMIQNLQRQNYQDDKKKMKINKQQDTSFHHKKDQSTIMHRTIIKMTNTLKGIKAL